MTPHTLIYPYIFAFVPSQSKNVTLAKDAQHITIHHLQRPQTPSLPYSQLTTLMKPKNFVPPLKHQSAILRSYEKILTLLLCRSRSCSAWVLLFLYTCTRIICINTKQIHPPPGTSTSTTPTTRLKLEIVHNVKRKN